MVSNTFLHLHDSTKSHPHSYFNYDDHGGCSLLINPVLGLSHRLHVAFYTLDKDFKLSTDFCYLNSVR